MTTKESLDDRRQRREASQTVHLMLQNVDALRGILRRIKEPGRALPSLAGTHLGRAAVLRVVQAVGVELILEHMRRLPDRCVERETDSLLEAMARWQHAPSASASARGWEIPIEPDASIPEDEVDWRNPSPRIGSVVVVLHTRDTPESFLHCGDGIQKHLFRVVHIHADNSTVVLDDDFATYAAAVAAHPDAAIRRASGPSAAGA